MSYQSYPGEVIDAEYVEVIPAQRRMGTSLQSWRASMMVGRVVEEAMVLDTRDQCLAMLAKAGIEHTAALSVMEAQF